MKCFYHNDMDGKAAGSLVALWHNCNYDDNCADFFEVDYKQPIPVEVCEPEETVYFVDYSFTAVTKPYLDKLILKCCNVIWIDHHTSSIRLQKEFPELSLIHGIRSEQYSGALLTYMYLWETSDYDNAPKYLKLVDDYDRWKFNFDPSTTRFKLGLETGPYNVLDPIWSMLLSDSFTGASNSQALNDVLLRGSIIKDYIDDNNAFHRRQFMYYSQFEGYPCAVINRRTNSWIFGNDYKNYPLVITWVFDGTKYNYSLYSSDPDVDCAKLAEKYGGGGHRGAAGFSCDKLLIVKQ